MPIPNPIKYSLATQSDALKKGNFYLGVRDRDYGPTENTGYYDGLSYSFYTTYVWTGTDITYRLSPDSSSLINYLSLRNNVNLNDLGSLVNWVYGQSDILVVDKVYSNLDTVGLVLYFDSYINSNFTYSRNGSAKYSYFNNSLKSIGANVMRFKYTTNDKIDGLLIEPQKTNNFFFSEQFDNSFWIKSDVGGTRVYVYPNQITSPLGDLTADLVVPTETLNGEHPLISDQSRMASSIFNTTYTWSIYAKSAGYNYFGLRTNISNQWSLAMFNLQNGTTFSVSSNYIRHGIENVGDGWYRLFVTATNSTIQSLQHISSPDGSISFTGDGASGAYIWGAQFESNDDLTSYITTTASNVTRPPDNLLSPVLNYNTSQWTIFFEIEYLSNYIEDSADVFMNPLSWYFRRTGSTGANFWNQDAQQNLGILNFASNSVKRFKALITFNGSTISTFINGTKVGNQITPTNLAPFSTLLSSNLYRLRISKATLITRQDSSHILRSVRIYTKSTPDSDAITMTTL